MVKTMFGQILLFLLITQISYSNSAMIDDARAELEILISSMTNAITGAHVRIDSYYERLETDSMDVKNEARVVIGYEGQRIHQQVETLISLAAGRDITECLGNYEQDVNNFTTVAINSMTQCIGVELDEGTEIVEEYKYLVDIRINRIHSYEFQLNLCEPDNEDCISPIYEWIKYERIYAVDSIDFQLIAVNNLMNQLRVIIQECSNLSVSEFIASVDAVLHHVSECVDQ